MKYGQVRAEISARNLFFSLSTYFLFIYQKILTEEILKVLKALHLDSPTWCPPDALQFHFIEGLIILEVIIPAQDAKYRKAKLYITDSCPIAPLAI